MAEQPIPIDPAALIPADVWNNRALDAFETGDLAGAESHWEHALQRDPRHLDTIFNRALHQWRTGQISDKRMLVRIEEVATNRDRDWYSLYLLGQALLECGEVERARAELAHTLALNPDSQEILHALDLANAEPTVDDLVLHDIRHTGVTHHAHYYRGNQDAIPRMVERSEFLQLVESYPHHVDEIRGLAFSPDGRLLFSSSSDSTLRLWDVESGQCLHIFHSPAVEETEIVCIHDHSPDEAHRSVYWHTNYALDVAVTAVEGTTFRIAGFLNGDLLVWDLDQLESPRHVRNAHGEYISRCYVSPDSRTIATGSDGEVRLWDVVAGEPQGTYSGTGDWLEGLYINPIGTRLMTCDREGLFTVWDLDSDQLIERRESNYDSMFSSGDGSKLMATTWSGEIVQLDPDTGKELELRRSYVKYGILLSRDGRHAIAHSSRDLDIVNPRTWQRQRRFRRHERPSAARAISPDGTFGVSSDRDGRIIIWRLQTPSFVAPFQISRHWSNAELEDSSAVVSHLLQKLDSALARSTCQDALDTLAVLRNQLGFERSPEAIARHETLARRGRRTELRAIWRVAEYGHEPDRYGVTEPRVIAFNRRRGVMTLNGTEVRFWDLQRRSISRLVGTPGADIWLHDVSLRANRAIWEEQYDGEEKADYPFLTSLDDTSTRIPLESQGTDVHQARFSSAGRWLFSTGHQDNLLIWDSASGKLLRNIGAGHWWSDYVTPDVHIAFSIGETHDIDVVSIPDGKVIHTLVGAEARSHEFASNIDASILATGGNDNRVQLWDLSNGKLLRQWQGWGDDPDYDVITGLGLSDDGKLIAFNDDEAGILIHDAKTGDLLMRLRKNPESWYWPDDLRFSSDNAWLVATYGGGDVYVWYLDWDIEIPEAADWDAGARPFLNAFLQRQQPYAGELPQDREPTDEEIRLALTQSGTPFWDEDDFSALIEELRDAGFGWLRPEGVRAELITMAAALSAEDGR